MLTSEAAKKICTVAESTLKQLNLMKSEESYDDVNEVVKFSKKLILRLVLVNKEIEAFFVDDVVISI
jgi:hypothetical protein